ncbi:hypothetical protein BGZ98_005502, partial [Dissophora globulifera]
MAVPARKLYWITAGIFLLVVFLSYHKNGSTNSKQQLDSVKQQQQQHLPPGGYKTTNPYDDNDHDYETVPGNKGGLYGTGATWRKSTIHSAEFNQAQIRELYGEFMEFNDNVFTNKTVTDRHAIWGDALTWA